MVRDDRCDVLAGRAQYGEVFGLSENRCFGQLVPLDDVRARPFFQVRLEPKPVERRVAIIGLEAERDQGRDDAFAHG